MMQGIALEFEEPIFTAQSKKISEVFESANHHFWVATDGAKVIGTVGMVTLSHENIVLKSMFVDKEVRGQGISDLLLTTVIHRATRDHYKNIYLGTMSQFIAGQKFYEKKGFRACDSTDLPPDFPINTLDTIFYRKPL